MTGARSAAPARQPLRRVRGDRLLLGVCAGIARSLDLSPLAVRIAVVVLAAVAAPLVLAGYVIAAAIVPRDDGRALLGGLPADRRETLLGWSLIGAVLVAFASTEFRLEELVWPRLSSFGIFCAAAAALALLVLHQRRAAVLAATPYASAPAGPQRPTPAAPQAPAPAATQGSATAASRATTPGSSTAAAPPSDLSTDDASASGASTDDSSTAVASPSGSSTDDSPTDDSSTATASPSDSSTDDSSAAAAAAHSSSAPGSSGVDPTGGTTAVLPLPQPSAPRGLSLGLIAAAVLLIGGALVFLLDAVGAIDPSATGVAVGLAIAAALAGGGAIAGGIAQRRGVVALIALGTVLAACAAGVGLLSTELDDGVGFRAERPATVSEIPATYRLGAGELDVDLRETDLPAGVTTVRARIGAGALTVLVPSGVRVESVGPTSVDGIGAVNGALRDAQPRPTGKRDTRKREQARQRAAAQRRTIRIDADIRAGEADVVRGGP
jgi:phage shock protein PspC (stress-responsive transcriptional regulator)